MSRWARILKTSGKVILVLFVILAILHGILTVVWGRRVQARLDALRAEGEPVLLSDLGRPKIPDTENAAVVYQKIFKRVKSSRMEKDVQRLNEAIGTYQRSVDPKARDEAARILSGYHWLIPIVEQAVSRPKCRFPVKWEAGPGALFPHMSYLRNSASLLAANAEMAAMDGRMEEAVHSVDLAFKVSESCKDDPTIIGQYVRVKCIQAGSKSLRDVLRRGGVNEPEARQLDQTLSRISASLRQVRLLRFERAVGIWLVEAPLRGTNLLEMFYGGDQSGRPLDSKIIFGLLRGYVGRPFVYANEVIYLDLMNKQVEFARLPYREMKARGSDDISDSNIPSWAVYTGLVYSYFAGARSAVDEADAEAAGSRIALALCVFRDRYGRYPTTLHELGSQIPKDVFSGKGFIYKRRGAGYLLYSVGVNLKDDGAVPVVRKPSGGPPEGYRYKNAKGDWVQDIVWEMDK